MTRKENQIKSAIRDADRALERAKRNIGFHDNAAREDIISSREYLRQALTGIQVNMRDKSLQRLQKKIAKEEANV